MRVRNHYNCEGNTFIITEPSIDKRCELKNAFDLVDIYGKTKAEKLEIIDFAISAIKNDIKYDYVSEIIYSNEHKVHQYRCLLPCNAYDENRKKVDMIELENITLSLNNNSIIPLPWNRERLAKVIFAINKKGFINDEESHTAYYYAPLDICFVTNGNHSVCAGICKGEGSLKAAAYDITPFFNHIYSDAYDWIDIHSNEKIIEVHDYRVAIIYELARLRYCLQENIPFKKWSDIYNNSITISSSELERKALKKSVDKSDDETIVLFRIDENLKTDMERVCKEMGLSMNAAFTIFATKVCKEKRIPFEVRIVK